MRVVAFPHLSSSITSSSISHPPKTASFLGRKLSFPQGDLILIEVKAASISIKVVLIEIKAASIDAEAAPIEVKTAPIEVKAALGEVKAQLSEAEGRLTDGKRPDDHR